MKPIPQGQMPGIYHRRIGDIVVTALSDGYYDTPMAAYRGLTQEEAAQRFEARFQRVPPRVAINAFLIRSGGKIALIDTGAGDTMGPTLGILPQTLAAAGVAEAEIDTILLTHLHPDHSNGLTGADGNALFQSAELVVSEADIRFRQDDGARAAFDAVGQLRYFDHPRFQIAPYADRTRDARGEVFPGVTAVPLPGHTPGHTGYMVESGGESLLIWGDICHAQELQFPHPEVTVSFDVDGEAAIATRRRVLDWVASDRLLVAGMHVHFPGFLHIVRNGDGFEGVPERWQYEMA